ncbi:ABC transporter ATP-binding protein [uncultured Methanobrevibacter sp.]|uniref:ABC transporter ATP-binding protein n=1 Tax=uncultured Methanobrevibacter sp. TaxID=253161 RepID=UPI0025DB125D|nr:ABC transporter ATP-binding protein [uncultured Methanobrevibacter sp.]
MVKKKNTDNISNDSENINNLQFNLNLDNLDDEKVKKEVFDLYGAINEGKIDLNPEEKKEILQELDLIINHLSNDEVKENSDIDEGSVEDSDFIGSVALEDDAVYVDDSTPIDALVFDDSVNDSAPINSLVFKDSVGSVDVDDSTPIGVSSVDDALDDLIGVDSVGSVDADDSARVDSVVSENFADDFTPIGVNSVDNATVDDALNDLIDDYSDEVAISVKNLSMEFKVSKDKIDTLKEFVIRTIKRNKSGTKIVTALEDVSFDIPNGDRVGIIGFNGAGKSTLLKILAGVYDATEGTIEVKGKIAPLLELGSGFDPNYTGKNNIFLNGAFLGYSEDFLKEKYDEILEFSELGEAIDYHVKTYSSGMRAKLAFSIATIVEPDILILDEILSVGDIRFRKKSADKIRSLINSGITVLLVSHSVAQIRDLCNKAIWIDEGKLKMYGEVNKVCDAYVQAAAKASRDQLKNIQLD